MERHKKQSTPQFYIYEYLTFPPKCDFVGILPLSLLLKTQDGEAVVSEQFLNGTSPHA